MQAVLSVQACCTEAGMFALRERRVHVTQVRHARQIGFRSST
jgi:ATP-dependent 26S proteasome regulatory subunit